MRIEWKVEMGFNLMESPNRILIVYRIMQAENKAHLIKDAVYDMITSMFFFLTILYITSLEDSRELLQIIIMFILRLLSGIDSCPTYSIQRIQCIQYF